MEAARMSHHLQLIFLGTLNLEVEIDLARAEMRRMLEYLRRLLKHVMRPGNRLENGCGIATSRLLIMFIVYVRLLMRHGMALWHHVVHNGIMVRIVPVDSERLLQCKQRLARQVLSIWR